MAFSIDRFSVFSAGQTGAGILCMYDGSGTDDEGGDAHSTITAKDFIKGTGKKQVTDLIAQGSDGRTLGVGIPFLARSRTGMEFNLLYVNTADGEVQVASGNWQVT